MSNTILGNLGINFFAKTADFDKKVNKSSKNINKFGNQAKISSGILKKLGAAMAGVASISFIKNTFDKADEIAKTSRQLGFAAKNLLLFRHAASLSGVEAGTLNRAIKKMQVNLQQGNELAAKSITRLGLSIDSLKNLSADQAFMEIDKAMQGLGANEKALHLFQIFGKAGQEIANLAGSGQIEKIGKEMNISFNAANIEKANDSMAKLKFKFDLFAMNLSEKIAPAIEGIFNMITDSPAKFAILTTAGIAAFKAVSIAGTLAIEALVRKFTAGKMFIGVSSTFSNLATSLSTNISGAFATGLSGLAVTAIGVIATVGAAIKLFHDSREQQKKMTERFYSNISTYNEAQTERNKLRLQQKEYARRVQAAYKTGDPTFINQNLTHYKSLIEAEKQLITKQRELSTDGTYKLNGALRFVATLPAKMMGERNADTKFDFNYTSDKANTTYDSQLKRIDNILEVINSEVKSSDKEAFNKLVESMQKQTETMERIESNTAALKGE